MINEVVNTEKLDIENFIEEIEMLTWQSGIELFKITEKFTVSGKRVYLVRGLTFELEDSIIIASDIDNIIIENETYVLMMMVEKYILSIDKERMADMLTYTIHFLDGEIKIQAMIE